MHTDDERPDSTARANDKLPFSQFWPLLGGALAGILLRFVFSAEPGNPLAAMSAGFIFGAPLIVGAVTVFLAERLARRSWWYYTWASAFANVLFVAGTLVIMIEGLICALLIVPLFALLGSVGGLIMGAACRFAGWPRRVARGFAMLPIALIALEIRAPLPDAIHEVQRSVLIAAPAAFVWREIQNIRDISPVEVERAWAFRIGVPTPSSGVTWKLDVPLRRVTMTKRVYFDQIVAELRDERYVRWHYRFYPDSFPPHALDDHVKIGGQYFDLIDTSYSLTPEGSATRLTLQVHYRLSTRFNWYVQPIVRRLLDNAAGVYLELYRDRAEHDSAPSRARS